LKFTDLSDITVLEKLSTNFKFHASPEGQKVLEDNGPFQASVFTPGSGIEKETRGKKLSEVDWSHLAKLDEYEAKIVEAYGFPRAK